jgi:hypothetical protein
MFKLFEIKSGKFTALPDVNPKSIKGSILVVVIVAVVIFLSGWLKIEEKELWKFYNSIIQHFGLKQNIPDIKNNEKKLEAEIESEVDRAIREYEALTGDSDPPRVPLPWFIEKAPDKALCYSEECKKLGGEMRLCAPWVDGCSKD